MSDHDESQDALSRLQSALDRIATRAAEPEPGPRLGEFAERLDEVIARLRDALREQ